MLSGWGRDVDWLGVWRRNVVWLGRELDLNGGGMFIDEGAMWIGCVEMWLDGGGLWIGWGGMCLDGCWIWF